MTRAFYVTIHRGLRRGFLAGPFGSLDEAEGQVRPARDEAEKIDPWTHFDTFGVTAIVNETERPKPLPPGVLNTRLGLAA